MEKTSMKQLIESTAFVTKTSQKQTDETVRAFIEGLKLALCKGTLLLFRDLVHSNQYTVRQEKDIIHRPAKPLTFLSTIRLLFRQLALSRIC